MRLLLRYHVARLRWIVRTSDTWYGFTHPGLVIRGCATRASRRMMTAMTTRSTGTPTAERGGLGVVVHTAATTQGEVAMITS